MLVVKLTRESISNMFPFYTIDSQLDVEKIAFLLKEAAERLPVKEIPEYSETETVARFRAEIVREELEKSRQVCAFIYKQELYSICFTKDVYKLPHQWYLSIGKQSRSTPEKASDEVAFLFAKGFFGDKFIESGPEGYWTSVRHFFQQIMH
jgi:hypothetical protein